MISSSTKAKVRLIVDNYKKLLPDEYSAVVDLVADKRATAYDEYASLEGLKESRALFEISETLQSFLIRELNEEQMREFTSKQGSRWFAREYREFALPQKI